MERRRSRFYTMMLRVFQNNNKHWDRPAVKSKAKKMSTNRNVFSYKVSVEFDL